MAQPAEVPNGMIASGRRDRDDLGLAVTEALDHEPGAQRRRVAEEFGEEYLTNAAGERLPDSGDADAAAADSAPGLSEELPSEAREAADDAGLEEREPGQETAEEIAAAEAALAAHMAADADNGDGSGGGDDDGQDAMIDALAAAETAYDAAHPEAAPSGTARHRLRDAAGDDGAAHDGREHSAGGARPGPAAAGEAISASGREAARRRLAAALAANPALAARKGDAAAAAAAAEASIHDSTDSRGVYRAALANAVRLAPTVVDISDLPRTALGRPLASPQQAAEQERTLPVDSGGLQGSVIKPRYT